MIMLCIMPHWQSFTKNKCKIKEKQILLYEQGDKLLLALL